MTDTGIVADLGSCRAVELAQRFHEIYERLAPTFGYETREETREFNPDTPNGRLMTAVCEALLPATQASEGDVPRLRAALVEMGRMIPGCVLRDEVSTEFLMLLPEEMRVWKERALPTQASEGGLREILAAIVRANDEAPDFGMCDQRDNGGDWYQSADLASSLIAARKALAALQPPTPADSVVVPRDMKAWDGSSERAPDDWDRGPVLFRSGEISGAPAGVVWKLGWGHHYGVGDVIAYTPRAATTSHPADTGLREAARFLLDRLVDHEVRMSSDFDAREWYGHVTPAMARLRAAFSEGER